MNIVQIIRESSIYWNMFYLFCFLLGILIGTLIK